MSLVQSQGASAGQSLISSFAVASDSSRYGPNNPRQKNLTHLLVSNLLVRCALPISMVDNEHFRAFLSELDSKFQPPCRQTVTHSILPQMSMALHSKLQQHFAGLTDVSLTCDIWTDRRAHAFLGVTVHSFVNGKADSHLLAFRVFAGSHTGTRIAEALETVIVDNNLASKIRFVVTDNAANMRRALTVLIEESSCDVDDLSLWEDSSDEVDIQSVAGINCEHIACFAHSLQLVVHDGLGCLQVARSVTGKCSKLANIVHQSALFRSTYEKALGAGKIVPSSNDTRWNSTFRQLQCIAELDQVKLNSLLRETNHDHLVFTAKDIAMLQELVKILAPFAEATDLTQGESMVTISCTVPILLSLHNILQSFLVSSTTFSAFIQRLLTSLLDRFSGLYSLLGVRPLASSGTGSRSKPASFQSNVFLMAAALDPAYAFHWIQDHPGSAEEKEALRNKITG